MNFVFKYPSNETKKEILNHNSRVVRFVLNKTNLKLTRKKTAFKMLKCFRSLREDQVDFDTVADSILRSLDFTIKRGRVILKDKALKSKKDIILEEGEFFLYDVDEEMYEMNDTSEVIDQLKKRYDKWIIEKESLEKGDALLNYWKILKLIKKRYDKWIIEKESLEKGDALLNYRKIILKLIILLSELNLQVNNVAPKGLGFPPRMGR